MQSWIQKGLFYSTIVLAFPALAYIPPARMILGRWAENQAQGPIEIAFEVVINAPTQSFQVREVWQIESTNTMKVSITGQQELKDQFKFDLLYRDGQKMWNSSEGAKSSRIPADFFERWFVGRSVDQLAQLMIQNRLVPDTFLNFRNHQQKAKTFTYVPADFVSLTRSGGVVTYFFGRKALGERSLPPGLWIEQDAFRIRKLRLPSQSEIVAEQYQEFGKGFLYPRVRSLKWANGTASIRVLSAAEKKVNLPGSAGGFTPFSQWPGEESSAGQVLKEFYSRFR